MSLFAILFHHSLKYPYPCFAFGYHSGFSRKEVAFLYPNRLDDSNSKEVKDNKAPVCFKQLLKYINIPWESCQYFQTIKMDYNLQVCKNPLFLMEFSVGPAYTTILSFRLLLQAQNICHLCLFPSRSYPSQFEGSSPAEMRSKSFLEKEQLSTNPIYCIGNMEFGQKCSRFHYTNISF